MAFYFYTCGKNKNDGNANSASELACMSCLFKVYLQMKIKVQDDTAKSSLDQRVHFCGQKTDSCRTTGEVLDRTEIGSAMCTGISGSWITRGPLTCEVSNLHLLRSRTPIEYNGTNVILLPIEFNTRTNRLTSQ